MLVEPHDTIAVPEFAILLGIIAPQVRLAGTASLRLMAPEKPFVPVRVTEMVPDDPWAIVREVGLALIVKLGDEGETTETLMFVV